MPETGTLIKWINIKIIFLVGYREFISGRTVSEFVCRIITASLCLPELQEENYISVFGIMIVLRAKLINLFDFVDFKEIMGVINDKQGIKHLNLHEENTYK